MGSINDQLKQITMDDGEKIEMVLEWAENVPSFDITFIESLKDYYVEHCELTFSQTEALDKIIEKWNIKPPTNNE